MNKRQHSELIFSRILMTFCAVFYNANGSPAATVDAMKRGEQMFNAGKFEESANWYKTELTKNPTNPNAHYMLGVSLSKLGNKDEAIHEFKLAKMHDKNGSISGYSDQYLQSLMRGGAYNSKNVLTDSHKNASTAPEAETAESTGKTEATSTATHVGKAANSASAALEAECDKEVERIQKDANQKIQGLTSRMERSLAEVPRSQYRPSLSYYQDQAIKAEYQSAVTVVRDEATKKEADIKAFYRSKQAAVEDSAYAMHKSYESKNQVGKIILSPVGTNMNIRNYQTADEASGNDVPVVAAPAKSLPVKKH